MNINIKPNLLCKLGIHKYRYLEHWPEELQPKIECRHDYHWEIWREKCERCGKIHLCDSSIKLTIIGDRL